VPKIFLTLKRILHNILPIPSPRGKSREMLCTEAPFKTSKRLTGLRLYSTLLEPVMSMSLHFY